MWGSKLIGNYAKRLGWAASNIGKLGAYGATGGLGRTVQGGMVGAAAGAGWGMLSDDTSVIGGALMGAGLGAGGARYGSQLMRGARSGWNNAAGAYAGGANAGTVASYLGRGLKAGGMRAAGLIQSDFGRARIAANRGFNAITGLGK